MKSLYFFIIMLILGCTTVQPGTVYVKKDNSTPVSPYNSRQTAADSIAKALKVLRPGDTLYILNGTYKEQIATRDSITILGENRDLTILDLNFALPRRYPCFYIDIGSKCIIKRLTIINGNHSLYENCGAIGGSDSGYRKPSPDILVDSVTMNSGLTLLRMYSGIIRNSIIRGGTVFDPMSIDTQKVVFENCLIESSNMSYFLEVGNITLIFKNCIIYSGGDLNLTSTFGVWDINVEFLNCLILWPPQAYQSTRGVTMVKYNLKLTNCTLAGRAGNLFEHYWGDFEARNCIFYGPDSLIVKRMYGTVGAIKLQYNLFNNCPIPIFADSTNFTGCDTPPILDYNNPTYFETRLDQYSEAINTGDPSLRDADGSRSDIGCSGGPNGKSYMYPNLTPGIPLKAKVYKNERTRSYDIFWETNCQPDFYKMLVYVRSAGSLVKCDNTNFVGETFTNNISIPISSFPGATVLYVNFRAVDSAGNISVCNGARLSTPIVLGTEREEKENDEGLQGIYPNPTTGMLNIRYSLSGVSKVSLTAFSATGEETAEVLCNEERQPGTYTQQVQLKGASGIYIVRLVVVNSTGVKKEYTQKVSVVK